ncbi:hypothetical protein [Massilia sp. Mn16-1_5]|uniref:hypothetical protein n=1 Tax=Massilia sp. Mn16-1_5 TaxID=2079199 RepID=UPI00109EB57C|nr:hypothetical protein [Massilia sp. Mn16-1_5]
MHELPFFPSHRCNLQGEHPEIPLGHCLTVPPMNGVSMLYNTDVFRLLNNVDAPKLATVRRTRSRVQQDTFKFRVNSARSPGWRVNVLFFERGETGYIELLTVEESPRHGSMDARAQIHDDVFHGDLPALRNSSPAPVFVSVQVYNSDDVERKRPSSIMIVFKPGQVIPVSSYPDVIHIDWYAAEIQKSSLYPPYWRPQLNDELEFGS